MTMHPLLIISSNVISIIDWNVAGGLHIPKNITVSSNSPLLVLNAAFHSSPCLIQMLLYPYCMSILEKYLGDTAALSSAHIVSTWHFQLYTWVSSYFMAGFPGNNWWLHILYLQPDILFPPGISNYKPTQIGLAAHIVSTHHFQLYTVTPSNITRI